MAFDLLTLDEVDFIEETCGKALGDIFDNGNPTAKVLRTFALVVKRRTDPTVTAESLGSISYEEAVSYLAQVTGAEDEAPKAPAKRAKGVSS